MVRSLCLEAQRGLLAPAHGGTVANEGEQILCRQGQLCALPEQRPRVYPGLLLIQVQYGHVVMTRQIFAGGVGEGQYGAVTNSKIDHRRHAPRTGNASVGHAALLELLKDIHSAEAVIVREGEAGAGQILIVQPRANGQRVGGEANQCIGLAKQRDVADARKVCPVECVLESQLRDAPRDQVRRGRIRSSEQLQVDVGVALSKA